MSRNGQVRNVSKHLKHVPVAPFVYNILDGGKGPKQKAVDALYDLMATGKLAP